MRADLAASQAETESARNQLEVTRRELASALARVRSLEDGNLRLRNKVLDYKRAKR